MESADDNVELNTLLNMAEYFAFKNYNDMLHGSLQQMGNMGVPPQEYPESLRNRLEFYGLRMVLLQSSADSLPSLLTNYDELSLKWAEAADRNGIPHLQWMTWRYKIVAQMGLNILRKFLHLPADHDAFVRPDTIKLPAKFDNAAYKKELNELFADINASGRKNTVAAKAEQATADMTRKQLLGILNENEQLCKYKIFFIFNGSSIALMRREVGAFISEVEHAVIGEPNLAKQSVAAVATATNSSKRAHNVEWSMKDRQEKGPQASPAPTMTPPSKPAKSATPNGKKEKSEKTSKKTEPEHEPESDSEPTKFSAKKTRSRSRQEMEAPPSKRGRPSKTFKIEPVTEAYTQLDDGSADEDRNDDVEHFFELNDDDDEVENRGKRAKTAVENLRHAREEYSSKHKNDDPLLGVLGSSPAPVVSHAAGKKGKQKPLPISPLTESPRVPTSASSKPKSASKKKRPSIIDARESADKVDFDDSFSDSLGDASSSVSSPDRQNSRKLTTPKKEKFPKSIELEKARRASLGGGVQRRVAWSIEEEDALIAGINRHGVGKWREILDDPSLRDKFRDRTNVQLKDKHRNLVRNGHDFELDSGS